MNPIWTPITAEQYATILTDQRIRYQHWDTVGRSTFAHTRTGIVIAYTPTKALVQPL